MKATGIVRKLDVLGRVVLPKELRDTFGWEPGTPVEVFVDGETVILCKYEPGCSLCGSVKNQMFELFPQKLVCAECVEFIGKMAGAQGLADDAG